jgi:hypothetical protein
MFREGSRAVYSKIKRRFRDFIDLYSLSTTWLFRGLDSFNSKDDSCFLSLDWHNVVIKKTRVKVRRVGNREKCAGS